MSRRDALLFLRRLIQLLTTKIGARLFKCWLIIWINGHLIDIIIFIKICSILWLFTLALVWSQNIVRNAIGDALILVSIFAFFLSTTNYFIIIFFEVCISLLIVISWLFVVFHKRSIVSVSLLITIWLSLSATNFIISCKAIALVLRLLLAVQLSIHMSLLLLLHLLKFDVLFLLFGSYERLVLLLLAL